MLQCFPFEAFPPSWLNTYLRVWKRESHPSKKEQAFFRIASEKPPSLLLVAHDEKFLGHAACDVQKDTNEVICQFRALPSFSNRGVEETLLSKLYDLAVSKGWKHILISHHPKAVPTRDFFLYSGGVSLDNQALLLNVPRRAPRMNTIGSLIDELTVANLQMWHIQEKLYETDAINSMNKSEMQQLLHRGTWLNLVRNRCIDSLDKKFCQELLPDLLLKSSCEDEPLPALLEHSRKSFIDFINAPEMAENCA